MGSSIWFIIIVGVLIWYCYIAIVVGIRGYGNIRDMLNRTKENQAQS